MSKGNNDKEADPLLKGKKGAPLPQYLDPLYWNPKCPNWEIIDWEKWDSLIDKPPPIYDPPQFRPGHPYNYYETTMRFQVGVDWFTHRSPALKCCCLPQIFQTVLTGPEKRTSKLTDDEFYREFLDPKLRSESVPEFMRGMFWLRDNISAPETVVSFEQYAWKSNPWGSGPVALGTGAYRWTIDETLFGAAYLSQIRQKFLLVQIHPEGKWISLGVFDDPTEKGSMGYLWIYVVQEGDEFKTTDGEILNVKPGDFIRCSYNDLDPYRCSPEEMKYQYTPIRVASISPETGELVKHQPQFDEMQSKVRAESGQDDVDKEPFCCGCFIFHMTPADLNALQRKRLAKKQMWVEGPIPPTSQMIDHL